MALNETYEYVGKENIRLQVAMQELFAPRRRPKQQPLEMSKSFAEWKSDWLKDEKVLRHGRNTNDAVSRSTFKVRTAFPTAAILFVLQIHLIISALLSSYTDG